jgi:mono/diheme cytochrome c family protein
MAIFVLVGCVAAFEAPLAVTSKASASSVSAVERLARAAAPLILAGTLAAANMDAAYAGDRGAGKGVFEANCAACHADGQNVIMPKKTLQKEVCSQPAKLCHGAHARRPGVIL